MSKGKALGIYQAGILVSDIDEALRLFVDTLGLKVVFEARDVIQPASGLAGNDHQKMNVLMLHGEGGVDLEIHQYVEPKAHPCKPMNHNDLGSMHFMMKVDDIHAVCDKVTALGYKLMNPIVESKQCPGFKFTYFRGPDDVMIELHEGGFHR
ncbi:MAG: VOC family protein [Pseudoramibacter sp.]